MRERKHTNPRRRKRERPNEAAIGKQAGFVLYFTAPKAVSCASAFSRNLL